MSTRPTIYPGLHGPLPIEVGERSAPGYMGMILLIATDGAVFACLLVSYFYLQASNTVWPPNGIKTPDLHLISISTVILWASSIPMQWAEWQIEKGRRGRTAIGFAIGLFMGLLFVALQGVEWSNKDFSPQANSYGSLFFTITGFHGLHVLTACVMNAYIQLRLWCGHFSKDRYLAIRNTVIFWHFVDLIWVFVYTSLYLTPYAI